MQMITPLKISYETYQELKSRYVDPYCIEGSTYSSLKACILATSAPYGFLFATWRKPDGTEVPICNGKIAWNYVNKSVNKEPT